MSDPSRRYVEAADIPPPPEPGVMVVSIDFEMAWGVVHRNGRVIYDIDDERSWLQQLLGIFDHYGIPATWATVGHLMMNGCGRDDTGVAHPDIIRPRYSWFDGDWFDQDPCGHVLGSPTWYAPDVVGNILERRVGHEIGCHTFSHIVVGDPGCSVEAFDSELRACERVARAHDVTLRSFVYPRNTIGHVPELVRHGYTAYRGRRHDPFVRFGRAGSMVRLVDRFRPLPASVVRPVAEDGIWNMPATCLFSIEGRRWPGLWMRQMRRRLRHAARHGGLFHVWFHPHNLVRGGRRTLDLFEELLAEAAELRDQGRLETLTMGAYADVLSASVR